MVPSLFPFFIATELLSYTNIVTKIGELFQVFMRPVFHVPGCGAYAFLMGMISGYPIGAKIVTKFRQDGLCTKEEGERLISFTNNSGPLFIVGTVGISLFGNSLIGFLLLITHILAGITTGFFFRFWKYRKKDKSVSSVYTAHKKEVKPSATFSNLGEILSKSILASVQTIVMIGGFVVLFSVILSILQKSHLLAFGSQLLKPVLSIFGIEDGRFATSILSGFLELTNGVKLLASIPIKNISISIIFAAFLLGFGGISVLLQVFSIISKTDLSIKPYFYGKLLHGIIAAFYTFLLITAFPIFNLNL